MKKEVCLMCIVCFFLGYFVADVISKCGFGKEHFQKMIYDEHLGDLRSGDLRSEKLRSEKLRLGKLRSEKLKSDLGAHIMPGGSSPSFPSNMNR
jgi:hypothetical protein